MEYYSWEDRSEKNMGPYFEFKGFLSSSGLSAHDSHHNQSSLMMRQAEIQEDHPLVIA